MKFYLKTSFILILLTSGLMLAIASTITYKEFSESKEKTLKVIPGVNVIQINLTGLVRIYGNIPTGVKLYFLSDFEYIRYKERNILPNEFLGEDRKEIWVVNPSYIVSCNALNHTVETKINIEIYILKKPFILLSFFSYPLIIVAVSLMFLKTMTTLKEKTNDILLQRQKTKK